MEPNPNDEHWLRPKVIECPRCGVRLFRVEISPFYDCYFLWCDQCPRRVEVSFYDEPMKQIQAEVAKQDKESRYEPLMRAIENRLQSCVCGGHFRHDSPRRCFSCNFEVIVGDTAMDLSPCTGWEDHPERDPTAEEEERYNRFQREFVRKDSLWLHDLSK
jgi:hypothetical protein